MLVSLWSPELWSLLLLVGFATPSPQFKILEKLESIPAGWYQGDVLPPPDQQIKLQIALQQQEKHDLLEEHLLGISTPGHILYGQHYDPQQLSTLLQPEPAVSAAVLAWIRGENILQTDIELDGDWCNFQTTVAQAEKLLNTKFHYFHHADNAAVAQIRTLQYSVPSHLHHSIQMIQPTTHFGRASPYQVGGKPVPIPKYGPGSATKLNATYCNVTTPPDCIRALYNIGNFKANASSGVKLGISGFNYQQAVHSDFSLFLDKWAPAEAKTSFKVVTSNGGINNETGALAWAPEANLDIQYAVSLSYGVPAVFYKTGGYGPLIPDLQQPNNSESLLVQEPFLEHLQFLLSLSQKDLPTVLSVSYGEDEQSHPVPYMRSVCRLFAKLGVRGVSVLVASGDTGPGDGCQTNDVKKEKRFQPQFPASCPWVTAVGGTTQVEPEVAAWLSGGGFSDIFMRPAYQDTQVQTYLNKTVGTTRFKGLYNRTGRGIPDVSAQALTSYPIFHMGQEVRSGGTSAATPVWAAVIANINSIRLSKGQKPLGFLNPWLYSEGYRGLTDITMGGSQGCFNVALGSGLDAPEVPGAGWNASVGWDAVTGLGTPDFEKLVKLATG